MKRSRSTHTQYQRITNRYVIVKLYKSPRLVKRKTLMNTCEELIKEILAKVKK